MTRTQAIFVKYLRIKCDCSWRALAAHYYNRYNRDGSLKEFTKREQFEYCTYGGNQIDGMELMYKAMEILNEKGWND